MARRLRKTVLAAAALMAIAAVSDKGVLRDTGMGVSARAAQQTGDEAAVRAAGARVEATVWAYSSFSSDKLDLYYATMTEYETGLPVNVVSPKPEKLKNILGEVVAKAGLAQFRCAETEKNPHVTFFFNNYRKDPFPGEDRACPASPKVPTYDLQPEMSAGEVTAVAKVLGDPEAVYRRLKAHDADAGTLALDDVDADDSAETLPAVASGAHAAQATRARSDRFMEAVPSSVRAGALRERHRQSHARIPAAETWVCDRVLRNEE